MRWQPHNQHRSGYRPLERENELLYEYLERKDAIGKHAAIPSREIICALHLDSSRELRKIAETERKSHRHVLAGDTGYFLPADDMDVVRYVKRLRGQAAAINAVADALEEVKADAAKEEKC